MAEDLPQDLPPAQSAEPVHVMSPDGELGTMDPSELSDATQNGYSLATPEDINNAKYGGAGQALGAAAEHAASSATFGLSTGLETRAGVPPEDIRGRTEAHPVASGVGDVVGLGASSLIPGVGEANVLREAGAGAAEAVGLGTKGAGFVSQVGADTVKGAFEAALFQGGDEVSKAFAQDPNQTGETAIANMGLASVMGGVFGGAIGAGLRGAGFGAALDAAPGATVDAPGGALAASESTAPSFISEVDRPALEAGDFKTTIENSNILKDNEKKNILSGLSERKPDASDIESAAGRLNAPVLEGMTSASKVVQKAEDSLLNGAPTYSGLKRQAMYGEGYKAANAAVEGALGDGSRLTKAEIGNYFKDSITKQISEQNKPISEMYNYLKQQHGIISLPEGATDSLASELSQMKELRVSPSSPGAKLTKNVIDELGNLKSVDDIKTYRSSLYDRLSPTAPPQEKRMAAIISDKLKTLEDASVESAAKSIPRNDEARDVISNLIAQRKAADSAYKPFINDVQTLAEQLGKGKIHGAQDAIHFINDLTPEQVTQKLFSKNNSEFLSFFGKKFPAQMEMMRSYQKNALREAASKSGDLSPKVLFNNINKLEPEIQRSVFSTAELQKLKDSEIYLRSFPESFNPSGTSGMNAFRSFFEHPTGAAIGNIRDLAIEKFIKTFGASPEIKNATKLAKATVSGWNTTRKAINAVLDPEKAVMPSSIAASTIARERLSRLVEDFAASPQKMMSMNVNNPVSAYHAPFSATSARAMQYLNTQKPNTSKQSPLDSKLAPTSVQKAQYDRALDIAQNPLIVFKHIQQGNLTPQDCVAIKSIYPNLYQQLCGRLMSQAVDHMSKGGVIPYKTRLGLSLFTSTTLDSTMTPQAIISAQPAPQAPEQQQSPPAKHSSSSLSKLPGMYKTPGQASDERRSVKD